MRSFRFDADRPPSRLRRPHNQRGSRRGRNEHSVALPQSGKEGRAALQEAGKPDKISPKRIPGVEFKVDNQVTGSKIMILVMMSGLLLNHLFKDFRV